MCQGGKIYPCASLTTSPAIFASSKSGLNGSVDINRLVHNAASILWHHIHTHTNDYQSALGDNIPPARGNAQQLEQVIIKLLVNALQALPDKSCGVRITTSHDPDAGEIIVTVLDEGTGMGDTTVTVRLPANRDSRG